MNAVISNPDEAFRQAIAEAGLHPPARIVADGALHRFASSGKRGDDAGWYAFHSDSIPSGAFGCWRLGTWETWSVRDTCQLTKAERVDQRQLSTIEHLDQTEFGIEGTLADKLCIYRQQSAVCDLLTISCQRCVVSDY